VAVLLLLALAACSPPAKNEEISCDSPYIKVGSECCLDKNNNQGCDYDEGTLEPPFEIDPNILNSTTVDFNPNILEAFESGSKLIVIVRLVDRSNIVVEGTIEEIKTLMKQRDRWFDPQILEVISSLSTSDLEDLGQLSDGFSAQINLQTFNQLIMNPKVRAIHWSNATFSVQT